MKFKEECKSIKFLHFLSDEVTGSSLDGSWNKNKVVFLECQRYGKNILSDQCVRVCVRVCTIGLHVTVLANV